MCKHPALLKTCNPGVIAGVFALCEAWLLR